MSVLEDNFDNNQREPWWDIYTPWSRGTVAETNQRLECTPTTADGGDANVGYVTANPYDLTEHFVEISVVQLSNISSMNLVVSPIKDLNNPNYLRSEYYQIMKLRNDSTLVVRHKLPGGDEYTYRIPWTGATGILRIELKADNKIYFYEDGVLRYSETYGLSSKNVYIYVFGNGQTGYLGTDAFDNFKSDIPTTIPEGSPAQPLTSAPKLPVATPEPVAGPATSIDAVTNRARWKSVFVLDPTTLEPVSQNHPLWVQVAPGSGVSSGQKTVTTTGTRVQLVTQSTPILSVTVKALATNTNDIYVGGPNVSAANGYVLSPGEPVSLDTDDLTDVWIDAAVSGEGVSFIYLLK